MSRLVTSKDEKGWNNHFRLYLSHDEVMQISDAGQPVLQVAALVATLADAGIGVPIISAGGAILVWLLKRADKKYGCKGVCLSFTAVGGMWFSPNTLAVSLATARIRPPDFSG